MPCGNWCALWKEYQREDDKGVVWGIEIQLCKTYHICKIEDFTDERTRGE
jgi:hypothetical protein